MNEAEARAFVDSLAQAGERRHPVAIPADFDQRCTPAQALVLACAWDATWNLRPKARRARR